MRRRLCGPATASHSSRARNVCTCVPVYANVLPKPESPAKAQNVGRVRQSGQDVTQSGRMTEHQQREDHVGFGRTGGGALEDQRTRELTVSLEDVKKATLAAPAPIDATRWLKRADGIPVIAEIKRASPSKGHLSDIPDLAALARRVRRAAQAPSPCSPKAANSSAALTISTRSRAAVHIPVLRKDFIVTDYQIFGRPAPTAPTWCCSSSPALDDAQLKHLLDLAHELGMTVLVETHTREEIERARKAGAKVIGINARNLKNLKVDVNKYNELAADLPDDVIKGGGIRRIRRGRGRRLRPRGSGRGTGRRGRGHRRQS